MRTVLTPIDGVTILEPRIRYDGRGYSLESYNRRTMAVAGIRHRFVQDEVFHCFKGVIRGLYYQRRNTQGMLLRVVYGSLYAVAVDTRPRSLTFGKYYGLELNARDGKALWIPPALAHGFSFTSDEAIAVVKKTNYDSARYRRSIRWDDPLLGIDWKLDVAPILSNEDQNAARFVPSEW